MFMKRILKKMGVFMLVISMLIQTMGISAYAEEVTVDEVLETEIKDIDLEDVESILSWIGTNVPDNLRELAGMPSEWWEELLPNQRRVAENLLIPVYQSGEYLLDTAAYTPSNGDQVAHMERLLTENKSGRLAFVGDGINDAPVLSRADIGIAMGALGSDAAIEAADVVLMNDDLPKIAEAVDISRKTLGIVRQNVAFALGVKALVLLLSAFGRAGMGAAVFADVGVALLTILNSTRALRVK